MPNMKSVVKSKVWEFMKCLTNKNHLDQNAAASSTISKLEPLSISKPSVILCTSGDTFNIIEFKTKRVETERKTRWY